MEILSLILFLLCFILYTIFSKSDLYYHQHDASIKTELEKFNTNFNDLDDLDIDKNYFLGTDHIYNSK